MARHESRAAERLHGRRVAGRMEGLHYFDILRFALRVDDERQNQSPFDSQFSCGIRILDMDVICPDSAYDLGHPLGEIEDLSAHDRLDAPDGLSFIGAQGVRRLVVITLRRARDRLRCGSERRRRRPFTRKVGHHRIDVLNTQAFGRGRDVPTDGMKAPGQRKVYESQRKTQAKDQAAKHPGNVGIPAGGRPPYTWIRLTRMSPGHGRGGAI